MPKSFSDPSHPAHRPAARESERARRARERVGDAYVEEGYVWPSFAAGNTMALRHGAHHPATYEPIALALIEDVLADRPDLRQYPEALVSWADSEARCQLLREFLTTNGMFNEKGRIRESVLRHLNTFDRRADAMRQRLGLDPRSAAVFVREETDAQSGLEALRERGRRALEEGDRER